VGGTLDHIGRILRDQGHLDRSRARLERALEIKVNALGDRHPEVAVTHDLLSSLVA
jgi:hypothetical protein